MEAFLNSWRGSSWEEAAATLGLRLAMALLLLVVGLHLSKWVSGIAERGLSRAHVEPTAVLFLRKLTYAVLLVVLLVAVLQVVGVPMTSMIAVLGAAGLAIGLALRDSLSNIASGVMLVTLKPFRVGDIVTVAGVTGSVQSISIFQTNLRGGDNQTITVPNSLITTASIVNLTPGTTRRIELVVGIGYEDDIQAARGAALAVMAADKRVLREPAPDVLVYALAAGNVSLGIRCHVANADHFVTRCELAECIKYAFDEAGVGFASPQQQVHVYQHAAAPPPPPEATAAATDTIAIDHPQHLPNADPQ